MDNLPQWDALSEGARAQLLRSVINLVQGDTQALIPHGDALTWDELRRAGVVQIGSDAAFTLTGAGTCLVLDVLQASGDIEHLVA